MTNDRSASVPLLPAISGKAVEPVARPSKLPQRGLIGCSKGLLVSSKSERSLPSGFQILCSSRETLSVDAQEPQNETSTSPRLRSRLQRAVRGGYTARAAPVAAGSLIVPTSPPIASSSDEEVLASSASLPTSKDSSKIIKRVPRRAKSFASVPTARKSIENMTLVPVRTSRQIIPRTRLFFVAQFGNCSGLIRQIMASRPNWTAGPGDPANSAGRTVYCNHSVKVNVTDDLPDIHFLWSQFQVKAFLDVMAEQQSGWVITLNEETRILMKQKSENPQEATSTGPVRAHNHFEGNAVLTSKAGLRETMVSYYVSHGRDPFGAVPLTFVIRGGSQDEEFKNWLKAFNEIAANTGQRLWLVKPGDKANKGKGISVCDSEEEVHECVDAKERVWVVQKYMEKPMLIHKRKFDIRAYCLVTQDPKNKCVRGYSYKEAYLRTTSAEYSIDTKDKFVHLNNDAVQKHGEDYGKYEAANKLSLVEFQKYLDDLPGNTLNVEEHIRPQMRDLMADCIKAAVDRLNPRNIENCFEVFGFDFMIDEAGRAWVIEVNTNPALEPCNTYLGKLIPKMLEEAFQLSLDQMYPSGAAVKPGATSGWEDIYCSTRSDANELTCTWLAKLPEGDVDLGTLGRDILSPCPINP